MKSLGEIIAIAEDVRLQRQVLQENNAAIDALKAGRSSARSRNIKATAEYYNSRAAYILELLTELGKAYCSCCKRVRPVSQMRIMRESGNQWKSDCSYDQWYEYWEHDSVLCIQCANTIEFTTSIHEGRKVGRELLRFDRAIHDAALSRDFETHDEIDKAMKLGLPAL